MISQHPRLFHPAYMYGHAEIQGVGFPDYVSGNLIPPDAKSKKFHLAKDLLRIVYVCSFFHNGR